MVWSTYVTLTRAPSVGTEHGTIESPSTPATPRGYSPTRPRLPWEGCAKDVGCRARAETRETAQEHAGGAGATHSHAPRHP